MIKISTKVTALTLALTLALGACSSGSSGSSGATPTTPPAKPSPTKPSAPASNAPADLLAFATAGHQGSSGKASINEFSNTTANGRQIDALVKDGGAAALVRDSADGRMARYSVVGNPAVSASTPDGVYTGEFDVSYKMNDAAPALGMNGNMYIELDMAKGSGYMDSIAGNDHNVIQVMGELGYQNGRLSTDSALVTVGDEEGAFLLVENMGKVDAILVDSNGSQGIFGKLGAQHESGFRMDGGMVLTREAEYNP